jgi:hypothetical protein
MTIVSFQTIDFQSLAAGRGLAPRRKSGLFRQM